MATAEYLRRPSVTVTRTVRRPVPTVAAPTLIPCVVGPCKQIVPANVKSATGALQINAQAQVQIPAVAQSIDAVGTPKVFSLTAKDCLVFNITNKQKVVTTFDVTGDYTPAAVADLIAKAMTEIEETDAAVEVVGARPGRAFRIVTAAKNDLARVEIDPEGRSAAKVTGTVDITSLAFPADVTGKTLIIAIDDGTQETITIGSPISSGAFITALSASLTGGTSSLEATTNFLELSSDRVGETSKVEILGGTLLATVGITNGSVDAGTGSTTGALTAFGFVTADLFFGADQYSGHELIVPPASFPDPRGNLDQLAFEVSSIRGFLSTSGGAKLAEVAKKTALLRKATAAVSVVDDGNGDNRSPFVSVVGMNFSTPTPTAAVVTAAGIPVFATLSNKSVIFGDGRAPRQVDFGTVTDIAGVVAAINAVYDTLDGLIASDGGAGKLRLTSTRLREDGSTLCTGEDSQIVVYGGSGASYLDNDASPVLKVGRFTGNPHKAVTGDLLYVDGVYLGKIIQVAPSGVATRLKLDKQIPLTFTGSNFYIVAQGLKSLNDGGATDRPAPDLIVEDDGQLLFKPGIIRNTLGEVTESVQSGTLYPSRGSMYVSYSALRLDVTSKGVGLLDLPDADLIEALLEPVDTTNPLALAASIAKLNAPLLSVKALGIDEISADLPEGTVEAHARAASFLEGREVYAIAPLSHDETVGAVWATHVSAMSQPERRRERVVLLNLKTPTHDLDALIASGAKANTIGNLGLTVDTGIGNLPQLLLEAGIDPTVAIPVSDGLFLDLASDSSRYSVSAVNGSVITLRIVFTPGSNTDAFYSETAIADTLVDETFGLRVRGAELVLTDGSPDLTAISDTLMRTAQSYANGRVWATYPDECALVIDGIEQIAPGYYMNAALVGMIAAMSPSQSFTNLGMSGVSRVIGSQDTYNDDQLDHMAYGGVYLLCQDSPTGPVLSRMALTTDRSSLEAQTDIFWKSLDFVSKYQRQLLKGFLGRTNVQQGTADNMNTVIQGSITFLEENNIVQSIKVTSLIRDPDRKDGYLLEENVVPFYPVNSIAVRIFI